MADGAYYKRYPPHLLSAGQITPRSAGNGLGYERFYKKTRVRWTVD
jgi:hypothetical protein